MKKIAIIGGTGLYHLENIKHLADVTVTSNYGGVSSNIVNVNNGYIDLLFLSRHGEQHQIAPHLINYRANIDALKQNNVTDIIAINAVGGIQSNCSPRSIVIPDQIIDYSYAREHTFYDNSEAVQYTDFSQPYSSSLRQYLLEQLSSSSIDCIDEGTYGVTQGPRLETIAEIRKIQNDGCTIVGMTAMPEAALAREAGINYASCCVVVNWAAGIDSEVIDMQGIKQNLSEGMVKIHKLINNLI